MPELKPTHTPPVRIDKYLWAVRLYKTRSLAGDACRQGKVFVGGQRVKPSREVRVTDVIEVHHADITRTVRVVAILENRVGPKLVAQYAEDLTPASEYLRQLQNRNAPVPRRPIGAGRPTKKERRQLDSVAEATTEFAPD